LSEQQWGQLVPGQQEEKSEPDVRQQLKVRRVRPIESLRTDQDPADEKYHYLGQRHRKQSRDNRSERCNRHDDEQRFEFGYHGYPSSVGDGGMILPGDR
jgi:hypothetical protein